MYISEQEHTLVQTFSPIVTDFSEELSQESLKADGPALWRKEGTLFYERLSEKLTDEYKLMRIPARLTVFCMY